MYLHTKSRRWLQTHQNKHVVFAFVLVVCDGGFAYIV